MTDQSGREGIDLFDFVAEAWRMKWLVAALVVIPIVAAVAWNFYLEQRLKFGDSEFKARVEYFVNGTLDPMQRTSAELHADLLERFSALGQGNYVQQRPTEFGRIAGKVYYLPVFDTTSSSASLTLTSVSADDGAIRAAYDHLQSAARAQFETTRDKASRGSTLLDQLLVGPRDVEGELPLMSFLAKRFLEDPTVAAGNFRFVAVDELSNVLVDSSRMRFSRLLVVAALIGGLLASVAVMVSIGLDRRRLQPAT